MLFDSDGAADAQSELGEWTVDKALSPWITASNGLQYRIHRVQHCFLADTWGRGKCYDLAHLSDAERLSRREHLLRHPQVCRRLQPHPHLPVNERVFPAENEIRWWVIDQWVPGRTLAEALEAGPLPTKMAARVLREIAIALKALHDVKIVRRELSPHYVILREKDGSVLLTDLELCKLLDGSPTVSKAWPADPYRAPEAGPEGVDETADLYSWGKILIHAVLGELPEKGCEGSALRQMNLPKPVENLVRRCVAESRRDRPSRVDEILKVMASWQ
jgi:serine/threonine protein kinase